MSSVTSGHRLSPAHPVDREAPAHNWTVWFMGAAVLVAVLYVLAFLMAGGA
ncbi:MAG TPA: hypothetical protein VIK31_03145 [Propionibacteriaceae bacterium]